MMPLASRLAHSSAPEGPGATASLTVRTLTSSALRRKGMANATVRAASVEQFQEMMKEFEALLFSEGD